MKAPAKKPSESEELAERIREIIGGHPHGGEIRMFGGICFRLSTRHKALWEQRFHVKARAWTEPCPQPSGSRDAAAATAERTAHGCAA